MSILGIDLGGTKLALALFSEDGEILHRVTAPLKGRQGSEAGSLIIDTTGAMIDYAARNGEKVLSVGISVPGISRSASGTVWAPNIKGWDDYPLLKEVTTAFPGIPVTVDSDRACYISGEVWLGNAKNCRDAVFLAVGTGIGAGILINGQILRGSHDIAGAIGWMALSGEYDENVRECGCFETYASGAGIAKQARLALEKLKPSDNSIMSGKEISEVDTREVFDAFDKGDFVAKAVIEKAIRYWGMATANIVSLFNPEKIIFGGGVFGPALRFLPLIEKEARKWAQPISITQVSLVGSALAGDAGVYGAGYLALKNIIR